MGSLATQLGTYQQGMDLAAGPADYWRKLLSGNRAEMMGAISPEVKTIRNQFANQMRNVSMFAPQGGGRAATMAEAPYQQAGAIQQLLANIRPQAAQYLASLGVNTAQLANQQAQIEAMKSGQNKQFLASILNPFIQQGAKLAGGWLYKALPASVRPEAITAGAYTPAALGEAGIGGVPFNVGPAGEILGGTAGGEAAGGAGSSWLGGPVAGVGIPAAMVGGAYLLSQPWREDWQEEANKQIPGTPVGPNYPNMYWTPTSRGMKMGTAQEYFSITGQLPSGYSPEYLAGQISGQ